MPTRISDRLAGRPGARIACRAVAAALPLLALALLTACGSSGKEAPPVSLKDLLPDEENNWTLAEAPKSYDRDTIFDYIDGAGEVYRSYDFRSVLVARYDNPDLPGLTVEIFDMGRPKDAYGVFSYSRDDEKAGLGEAYEQRGSLLSFWKGRYYVTVLAGQAGDLMQTATLAMGRRIAGNIPPTDDGRPDLVERLPAEGLIAGSVRFFHIHPSLNYHYYLAQDNILNLSRRTDAVLARYAPGKTHLLCIRYESPDSAAAARTSFVSAYLPESQGGSPVETQAGLYAGIRRHENYLIVILDANGEASAARLLQATAEKLTDNPGGD
jgi:hypothetical protein